MKKKNLFSNEKKGKVLSSLTRDEQSKVTGGEDGGVTVTPLIAPPSPPPPPPAPGVKVGIPIG